MRRALFITLDNTLIVTKSGKEYPLHSEDWKFTEQAREVVKDYLDKNYMVCIISNQYRIAQGFLAVSTFTHKINTIVNVIKTDLNIMRNIVVTKYCKDIDSYNYLPKPGMLYELALEYKLDLVNSVFVGNSLYDKDIINYINIPYIDVSNLNY